MAQASNIEWTDLTWNPVHGCSKVSPGCAHCYAETLSLRYRQTTLPWTLANAATNVLLKPHKLREPLSGAKAWRGQGAAAARAGVEGKLVFVNSTSDLFHEQVTDEFIARVFAVMNAARQHAFQVLTKRPERMRTLLVDDGFWKLVDQASSDVDGEARIVGEPLANVWLGVSIENRRFVGRADALRETPAAVRFISAEPLLGPLLVHRAEPGQALPCVWTPAGQALRWSDGHIGPELVLDGIDWLILGGESGPGHRPLDTQWMRDLRDACQGDDRPQLFVKQMGGARPGGALADLPEDLRIRDFPGVRACV